MRAPTSRTADSPDTPGASAPGSAGSPVIAGSPTIAGSPGSQSEQASAAPSPTIADERTSPAKARSSRSVHAKAAQDATKAKPATSNALANLVIVGMLIALVVVFAASLGIGRFSVPISEVVRILGDSALEPLGLGDVIRTTWLPEEYTVIATLRLPRAVLAALVGAGLAVSGAVLQALFRNPLVSPDVVGVSSGASFGGVMAILMGGSAWVLTGSAFGFGLAAVLAVMMLGRIRSGSPILMIVLGGIVVSAFCNALVSLITYVADPYTTLPSITFWLMGSLAAVTWPKVAIVAPIVLIGILATFLLRWRINILSLGDEDAQALGINPGRLRFILVITTAAMTASTVAAVGVVGWVGLVIPHLVRLWIGSDHRTLITGAGLTGATYLLIIDTLARSLTQNEIPVGILTALVGAPFFVYLLVNNRKKEATHA